MLTNLDGRPLREKMLDDIPEDCDDELRGELELMVDEALAARE